MKSEWENEKHPSFFPQNLNRLCNGVPAILFGIVANVRSGSCKKDWGMWRTESLSLLSPSPAFPFVPFTVCFHLPIGRLRCVFSSFTIPSGQTARGPTTGMESLPGTLAWQALVKKSPKLLGLLNKKPTCPTKLLFTHKICKINRNKRSHESNGKPSKKVKEPCVSRSRDSQI